MGGGLIRGGNRRGARPTSKRRKGRGEGDGKGRRESPEVKARRVKHRL